jgi:cytochrome c oxidase assembly protein subunit 15
MTHSPATTPETPRWLQWLAVATVCAALPLLLLGAEVTTKKVGMVDQKGFREPWHLFVALWEYGQTGETPPLGLVIEHAHRLAGFLVGICAIVLAAGLWFGQKRLWLRWLGVAALGGVIAQGILGIFRVNLNAVMGTDLALVHGCFAQLVFALLVSVALVTSRAWQSPQEPPANPRESLRLWRWALATTGLVYLQIVLGAVVRHRDFPYGARLHLLAAFGVVAAVVWLARLCWESQPHQPLMTSVKILIGLVIGQLVLGVEAWMSRFPSPLWNQAQPLPVHPELFRSLHYFLGALVFATTLMVTLQAYRRTIPMVQSTTAPVGHLEGAA